MASLARQPVAGEEEVHGAAGERPRARGRGEERRADYHLQRKGGGAVFAVLISAAFEQGGCVHRQGDAGRPEGVLRRAVDVGVNFVRKDVGFAVLLKSRSELDIVFCSLEYLL